MKRKRSKDPPPRVALLLAARLKAWRTERKLTRKRAAADLGVSLSTWGHWERAFCFPKADDLDALADYLGVPHCRLLETVTPEADR